MNKKPTIVLALLFTAAAALFGATPAKPNIVFIFADDWGWADLSCHDHPYVKTPNIDRLAKEGTDFYRFTTASGVCSPSRTGVMTGQFPSRFNIDGHFAWVDSNATRGMPDWLSLDAPTLPRMLQKAGYATGHYGKWHLSNDMIPDSPSPLEYGYDAYGAFNVSGEQMPYDQDVDRAIAFIEQAQKDEKPFFINLWIHEPHTPFHVLPKYQLRFPDLDEADNIFAATLSYADDRIGELLDFLDAQGLTENTVVIFSSDNGPARNSSGGGLGLMYDTATGAGFNLGAAMGITGGRKAYKAALYEGGIGVPFIARWPGNIPAGAVNERSMLSAVDLLPTFLEIADVELPKGYQPDGVSQLNALQGASVVEGRETPLFWKREVSWPASERKPEHWASYAVVHGKWKILISKGYEQIELYDIVADPLEQYDVTESQTKVVAEMLEQFKSWLTELPEAPDPETFSKFRGHADAPKQATSRHR